MGIKGINKKSHQNLIEALDRLKEIQRDSGPPSDAQQITFFKEELNQLLAMYETILEEVIGQVAAYDRLAMQIKLQFVNRKLRTLKNIIPKGTESFSKLKECISLINAY
ncbi:hypothetical protein ACFOWA_14205 [Pedobacter lithocola]|uniref:Uncharacterized protein n=1 Tax=Pedobacter lithocola TaxID=1908239 RepID=A0ABV8PDV1_9SPHI